MLIDCAADKLNASLLVVTDRYKVIICFDSRSPSYLFQSGVYSRRYALFFKIV